MTGGAVRERGPTLSVAVVGTVPALADVVGRLLGRCDERLVVDTLEGTEEVAKRHYDCVVCPYDGHRATTDLLAAIREEGTDPAVVLVGRAPAEDVADPALDEAATAYVRLPADPGAYDAVAHRVRAVAERATDVRGGRSTDAGTGSAGLSRND